MSLERVLLTGAAGFLGPHLAADLLRHGTRVRIFDIAPAPPWAVGDGIEYRQGDIRDEASVRSAVAGVDAVVHAAFASARMTLERIESVNVEGAKQVCAAARLESVPRLILISSTVAGWPRKVHPFLKKSPLNAFDSYRASRAEAERIFAESGTKGLSTAVVRPKTFLGAGRTSAFNIVFEWIRLGKPVLLPGDGAGRYQLLEIRDMSEGIRLLADSPAQGVFHFGAHEFGSLRDDLQALIEHAGTGSRLRFLPPPVARAGIRAMELFGMVPLSELHYKNAWGEHSEVDTSRAVAELGWSPRWTNRDALRHAYDWYRGEMAEKGSAASIHVLPPAHRLIEKLIQRVLG